jgi:hypothetical protein
MGAQEKIDSYYHAHGPCCAGCDFWRWINSRVGECVRMPPNQSHDAAAALGMLGSSLRSTSNLTTREHWCGEFRDTHDWGRP